MEQGDQVIKAPWSSWQFGSNYNYNSWNGVYKGRGDKTANIKYTRSGSKLDLGTSSAQYGATSLGRIIEPVSAVPIDAAVNPKNINKVPPSFTVSGAGGGLPAFSSRIITEATAPNITSPNPPSTFMPPTLSFVGLGFGQGWSIGYEGNYRYGTGSTTVIVENYQNYNTNGSFDITMGSTATTWAGTMNMSSTTSEVIGDNAHWVGSSGLPLNDILSSGNVSVARNAFINELRDHDSIFNGTYVMRNTSGAQRIFLSYNPAGRSTGYWLGLSQKRTATFNATLDLHGGTNGITIVATPTPAKVYVTTPNGITTLDLSSLGLNTFMNTTEVGALTMYVDTSGVNYTNPIQGLSNLAGLTDINLMFGTKAARYTNAKAIEIGDNILTPCNNELSTIVTAGTTLNVTSGSLTWMAQPVKDQLTGLLDTVYLVKIPYQSLSAAGDTQTSNFLTLLDEKYETAMGRDKDIFNKLNDLGKSEAHILAQAIDQMKGHQYSNVQQRIEETGNILEKEFNYLQSEWRNPTKQNNKIKAFGYRGEYNTNTAGVEDYTDNAYGVAYVHENETVKLGNTSGWYAGAVTNNFEFKDLGSSKETQTLVKAGIFKTISPAGDHNGSLQWKISGEGFAGRGAMKRRFWVVDDTFEAKGDYTIYGLSLKNEISKDIRVGERISIRPYASLALEYGRFTDVSEKGDMALEIKANDYFSVKPEIGIGVNYKQPVGEKSFVTLELTASYESELGKVRDIHT